MASAEERLKVLSSRAANVVERARWPACWRMSIRPSSGPTMGSRWPRLLAPRGARYSDAPDGAQARAAYDRIVEARRRWHRRTRRAATDDRFDVTRHPRCVGQGHAERRLMDMNLGSLIACAAVDTQSGAWHCDSSCFAYVYLGFWPAGTSATSKLAFASGGWAMNWSNAKACGGLRLISSLFAPPSCRGPDLSELP